MERDAPIGETSVESNRQVGPECLEGRVGAPDHGQRIGDSAPLRHFDQLVRTPRPLPSLSEEQHPDLHVGTLLDQCFVAIVMFTYAREMFIENQDEPRSFPSGDQPPWTPKSSEREDTGIAPIGQAASLEPASISLTLPRRGLPIWFGMLVLCGVGGLLLGLQELAGLAALAGLFVASQSADVDPQWESLHNLLSWVVPVCGGISFLLTGFFIHTNNIGGRLEPAIVALCVASAIVIFLTAWRPVSNHLVGMFFRPHLPSHTLRLAARLILTALLFAVPGTLVVHHMFETLFEDVESLLEGSGLGSGLIGYVLVAFAAVGLLLRRTFVATMARLGLSPLTRSQLVVLVVGVIVLYGLNTAADWIQREFFRELWESDQRVNESIIARLGPGEIVLLGLSAGVGEEITLRGALQPKLGLFWTALVFAGLHVQYSWFGIIVIFLLGLILGLIRRHTSTTVAIGTHMLYDIAAVLTLNQTSG
jgi:hypothetical protein